MWTNQQRLLCKSAGMPPRALARHDKLENEVYATFQSSPALCLLFEGLWDLDLGVKCFYSAVPLSDIILLLLRTAFITSQRTARAHTAAVLVREARGLCYYCRR